MVSDYFRYPRSKAAGEVALVLKPKSMRFKKTAIASGIAYYKNISNTAALLEPKKAKVVIQKLGRMRDIPIKDMIGGKVNPPKAKH